MRCPGVCPFPASECGRPCASFSTLWATCLPLSSADALMFWPETVLPVGSLRVDIGRHPNDALASQLVGELAVSSEHFRK